MSCRQVFSLFIVCFSLVHVFAKDSPNQVLVWPQSGAPSLRFTFAKFREEGTFGREHAYICETTAENLTTKVISSANFSVYFYDKNKVPRC
jgi:hypothetical protein